MPNAVVILMAQTVSRRTASAEVWDSYKTQDLMIIDEAHHATAEGWARAMRQWPGPVLGMTATPWRLSQREGFDHLFGELISGPQVAELQSDGWLCNAYALSPPEDELVLGGQVDGTGEYSEPGIEEANRDNDIWTAGALTFWQKNGESRQTLVYAVSIRHARNLANVFNDAGIPAGVLVANTPESERAELISRFQRGELRILVNVAVATEGFDLPDASCVLITRPTMSLALYLQMVGRGLRPKPDSGDCIVLDMTDNSRRHGLPEDYREWTLTARGKLPPGMAPLIRCNKCETLSPAASHHCIYCGEPFGETCGRCGTWRAREQWNMKTMCGQDHELVCDLCHHDAHILANLPVTQELEALAYIPDEPNHSNDIVPFLRNILDEERRRLYGTVDDRRDELHLAVRQLESDLANEMAMYRRFQQYIESLPDEQRPSSMPQLQTAYTKWENNRKAELENLKTELATLQAQPIDGQLILSNAQDRILQLLEAEAVAAGLIQGAPSQVRAPQSPSEHETMPHTPDANGWVTFTELAESCRSLSQRDISFLPQRLKYPQGNEVQVSTWSGFIEETAEWLIREGLLTKDHCPVVVEGMHDRCLINSRPVHPNGRYFRRITRLSNGLYLEANLYSRDAALYCAPMVKELGKDPAQFRVQLSQ